MPLETYRAAIRRALEAHLDRVKDARRTRDLAVSTDLHRSRRLAVYNAAKEAYQNAVLNSDAQRAKDDADALAALRAAGEAD